MALAQAAELVVALLLIEMSKSDWVQVYTISSNEARGVFGPAGFPMPIELERYEDDKTAPNIKALRIARGSSPPSTKARKQSQRLGIRLDWRE